MTVITPIDVIPNSEESLWLPYLPKNAKAVIVGCSAATGA